MIGLFLALLLCTHVCGEISLSYCDLGEAIKVENSIINTLDEYTKGKSASQDVSNVKRYIGNFKDLANNLTDDFEDPLQAYLIVKHFTDDFEALKNSISDKQIKDAVIRMSKMRSSTRYPTSKDLDSTAQSVIRLQQVYNLKIEELIKNKKLNKALGMFDYFRLAGQSLLSMDVSLAIDWFETALKSVNKDSNLIPKQTLDAVKDQFHSVKSVVGTNFESLRQQIKGIPDFMIDALALQFPGIPVAIIKKFKAMIENVGDQKIDKNYMKLCRGKDLFNDILNEDKVCLMMTRGFKNQMSPFKVEILSTEPAVFLIHDLTSKSNVNYLQQYAATQFHDSEQPIESFTKGAVAVSLQEISDEILSKLALDINKLSGLKVKQRSEHFVKILNYGIGGYDDYSQLKQVKRTQSPKITVDVFLNDAEQDAKTVFPGLRFGVAPTKGSALFVYHSKPNKRIDTDSFYASCPVRSGSKWVLRKEFF